MSKKEENGLKEFSLSNLESLKARITTGSLIFDEFLDGGFGYGTYRFAAMWEHGKTLQALLWANGWLDNFKEKGHIYFYDAEGRLSISKLNQSIIANNKYFSTNFHLYKDNANVFEEVGKHIIEKINFHTKNDEHAMFIIDSLDMLSSQRFFDTDLKDDARLALEASFQTKLVKFIGPKLSLGGHHLHLLSQIRANVNMTNPNSPKEKVSGSYAMNHQLDLFGNIEKNYGGASGNMIYDKPSPTSKDKPIGHYHTIRFTKTFNEKSGATIRIPIKRGGGIWKEREILDLCIMYGIVTSKGAWFYINEDFYKKIPESITQDKIKISYQGYNSILEAFTVNTDFLEYMGSEIKKILF